MALTRAALAGIVADRLSALATELGWSTAVNGLLTEGSYTYAIDSALRDLEFLDVDDNPDITEAGVGDYNNLVELVERFMLSKAERALSLRVDLQLGPRRQAFSQQAAAVRAMGQTGGNKKIVVMRLHHERFDYPRTDDVDEAEGVNDGEW